MAAKTGNAQFKQKKRFFKPASKKKFYLEAGLRGFFCTCNFREKDCVRESYNILNEYADMFFCKEDTKKVQMEEENLNPDEDLEDISDVLSKEISQLKEESSSKVGLRRFQAVETGVANCIFIRSNLTNLVEFVSFLIDDLIEKQHPKTRYLLRLMPILATCRADLKSIIDCAGLLFDEYFLKEPKTFSIVFNRRYNNVIMRDDVVKELADIVVLKNSGNKADLKNPDLAVIVEIVRGFCLLSVVPKYYQRKKYNINELGADSKCATDQSNDAKGSTDPSAEIDLDE